MTQKSLHPVRSAGLPSSRPSLPAGWFSAVCRYLDHEEATLQQVCRFVQQVVQGRMAPPLDVSIVEQATQLTAEMESVRHERECVLAGLQASSRTTLPVRISAFPWGQDERPAIDAKCRAVRLAAAQLAGVSRAGQRTLLIWSDVLGSLLQVLTGVAPHEATYTANGQRIPLTGTPQQLRA